MQHCTRNLVLADAISALVCSTAKSYYNCNSKYTKEKKLYNLYWRLRAEGKRNLYSSGHLKLLLGSLCSQVSANLVQFNTLQLAKLFYNETLAAVEDISFHRMPS